MCIKKPPGISKKRLVAADRFLKFQKDVCKNGSSYFNFAARKGIFFLVCDSFVEIFPVNSQKSNCKIKYLKLENWVLKIIIMNFKMYRVKYYFCIIKGLKEE